MLLGEKVSKLVCVLIDRQTNKQYKNVKKKYPFKILAQMSLQKNDGLVFKFHILSNSQCRKSRSLHIDGCFFWHWAEIRKVFTN